MDAHLAGLGDAELGAALRELAGTLMVPQPRVDPARAARLRIEAAGAPRPRTGRVPSDVWPGRLFGRSLRRSLVMAVAALLLLVGLAAALGVGLPGLRIIFVGPTPTASPGATTISPATGAGIVAALRLGRPVDVASIDTEAGFHVRLPNAPGLASPIGAVIELAPGVRQASLAYPPTAEYPAAGGQPVGILVTELPASLEEPVLVKFVGPGTTVEQVAVGEGVGYWISGAPHQIAYLVPARGVVTDSVRLAGKVLAWNDGRITYRIEGAADLETALAIAASMR